MTWLVLSNYGKNQSTKSNFKSTTRATLIKPNYSEKCVWCWLNIDKIVHILQYEFKTLNCHSINDGISQFVLSSTFKFNNDMFSSYLNKVLQWATESKRTVKADYREIKKQTSIDVFIKSFSESMPQIYRRIRMLKCDFNKVALQLYWNHTSALKFSSKFAAYFKNTFS